MRERSHLLAVPILLGATLTGCAGVGQPSVLPTVTVTASPAPAPTVTVTAQPAPAPTVTAEVERQPDAPLTKLEARTICASAGLGALHDAGYSAVLPMRPDDVFDNGDDSFTAILNMDPAGGLQPVLVRCEVEGTMGDPRVSIDLSFYDSQ